MSALDHFGWDRLRHGGLLLDAPRLQRIAAYEPPAPPYWLEPELRRRLAALEDGAAGRTTRTTEFARFILERVCGFGLESGTWLRGTGVPATWSRRAVTGEAVRPHLLWQGPNGAMLPVFIDDAPRLGIGHGRRATSRVAGWLRAGPERLALITNGRGWRLVFAGADVEAWCEWDADQWLEEGGLSPQVTALRTLIQPVLFIPEAEGEDAPLAAAVLDSRKGQAELSALLGERVREAVEILVQGHGEVLRERLPDVDPGEIYRAAVRVVMRMVVVLFAESRELLPRESPLYHGGYGLGGLQEELARTAARGGGRLARAWSAWPRVLALFRLVDLGSHHPDLAVPAYGGDLFAPGNPDGPGGLERAVALFERACFEREVLYDRDVHLMLDRLTRTRVKVRQGRSSTWVPAPVDFGDLSSEYIGILYEGLLDFELRTAPAGDLVVFLALGNQPALPLSRLEAMDDRALEALLDKMKKTRRSDAEDDEAAEAGDGVAEAEEGAEVSASDEGEEESEDREDGDDAGAEEEAADADERHTTRTRAEIWARRAVTVGGLVRAPRGRLTPERRLAHEEAVSRKARHLVTRVVLPGEWYLVRWGGTRKGSGTFYTRPGLAVPTVARTLRLLAYDPPLTAEGAQDPDAPAPDWVPKTPEQILLLKVCDPACGSGTFPVVALRFLTEALYASLHHHERIRPDGDRSIVRLLDGDPGVDGAQAERLCEELLPCPPDDPLFEPRLKAVLRRHVVERSIYAVDLDPLAVELCRLALWIETMDRTLPFSFLDHKVKCGNSLVGAWFDTFQHYPVMAFKNREGGDKNHSNGVHFEKNARTQAIKSFVRSVLTPDLRDALQGQLALFAPLGASPADVHDAALATLARLHTLPVQDAGERARIYREEFEGSPAWRALKDAMDLWCACWFWPADALDCAPLPSSFAVPAADAHEVAQRVAVQQRFFHWEIEFPDVFCAPGSGFHAVLGNPPWETLQPNPEEWFSNADPMFRAYGRLEKLEVQRQLFTAVPGLEAEWLDYAAAFNSMANWVGCASSPFGDPESPVRGASAFSVGRGGKDLHRAWRGAREGQPGYADPRHPYRQQMGRIFTYRLFTELAHVLLAAGGRLGFVVPSGIYSDAWSRPLRELLLNHCSWEWLFGFENRDKIFDIHRSFKFNPIVVAKGGSTDAIRTAFMRRRLEDWERAEEIATPYGRAQVEQFSPESLALLEVGSARDLQLLERVYANCVLLGDKSEAGWGVQFQLEYMMNTHARLFPPRSRWEADGYRPDEYSRWVKGGWRPIEGLWAELGVKPLGSGERRCAQPPYDTLPVPRSALPAGVVLSRDGAAWMREEEIDTISRSIEGEDGTIVDMEFPDVGLPLYVGKMVYVGEWAAGASGPDGARQDLEPDYLLAQADFGHAPWWTTRAVFRDISNSTNERTFVAAVIPLLPCGNVLPVLDLSPESPDRVLRFVTSLGSLASDWVTRLRMSGTHLNWHVIEPLPLPRRVSARQAFTRLASRVHMGGRQFAAEWLRVQPAVLVPHMAPLTPHERLRLTAVLDAVAASELGLDGRDLAHVLRGCDRPHGAPPREQAKGFWRVDKDKDPELRHTVLTLIAFHDLEERIRAAHGDRERGIESFLTQNDGEGWMLPETLRLSDYGLGHDERARQHQPVASRLGPRFYDWQLAQGPEESWRECHLHARNLLGEEGYRHLLAGIEQDRVPGRASMVAEGQGRTPPPKTDPQGRLF